MTEIKPPAVFEIPQFPPGTRVYWWEDRKHGTVHTKLRMTGLVRFQEGHFVRVEVIAVRGKGKPTSTEVNVLADELQRVY